MLCLNGLNVSLDRRESGSDIDFISHAHSDHTSAAKSSKHVLASDQTVQLMERAYDVNIGNIADNTGIRLLEAGHMLGAKQMYIEDSKTNERIVYTGDFQMQKSRTANPIEVVETDSLIMTSVYPDPGVVFDDKEEVAAAIQQWVGGSLRSGIVLFSAYAMGKAQELIALLNEADIKPVVSRKICRVNEVYESNGIALDYASAYSEKNDYSELVKDNFVGITERRDVDVLAHELASVHGKKVSTAVATGFAKVFRFRTDAQFALSDHADFNQSVEYIEAAKAKKVLTYGSNCERFAENLCKKGYSASPFSGYGKVGNIV
jgi:putative mRNA 3-end processing factor